MAFEFPANFDVATHRAYRKKGSTKVVVAKIPQAVLNIAMIEPDEGGGDPFASRARVATRLAGQGHVIDAPVDVWGWGAANTHKLRTIYGREFTPDITGNYEILVFDPNAGEAE
jgi:hypothetical protein